MSEAKTWDRLSSSYDKIVGLFDRSYPRVRELLRSDTKVGGVSEKGVDLVPRFA